MKEDKHTGKCNEEESVNPMPYFSGLDCIAEAQHEVEGAQRYHFVEGLSKDCTLRLDWLEPLDVHEHEDSNLEHHCDLAPHEFLPVH